ncbi:MAG: hypothetical protein MK005_14850 [Alcanivorax sp.]|nr:hypothetical protein [Alcanivorax sp.]|tara:strand:+ start:821 stop:1015 length:195 start_codon:yes stop_codon:yes gene_type:complete
MAHPAHATDHHLLGAAIQIPATGIAVVGPKVESLTFGSYLKYSGYLLVAYTVGFAGVLGVSALL